MTEVRGVVQVDAPAQPQEGGAVPAMGDASFDQPRDTLSQKDKFTDIELADAATDAECSDKDDDEEPKSVVDAERMCNMVASRGAFMAAFTYYQIGRYRYTPTVSYSDSEDILYVIFTTLSFQSSVFVAILAFSFAYYLNRSHRKHAFCITNINITRCVYLVCCFASLPYLLGLGRIGFVYYPGGYMKLCPMYMMCVFTLLLWLAYNYIPRIGEHLHTVGTDSEEIDGKLDVAEAIVNNSEYGQFKRGVGEDAYEDQLIAQCNILSGRAIFIAGLGQQGMLRFMPNAGLDYGMGAWLHPIKNSPAPGGTPHFAYDNIAANSFIVFATLATGLAFVSGFIFTALDIWINDAAKKKQLAFAILVTPLARAAFIGYSLSLCSISVMLILTGYGTNTPKGVFVVFGCVSAASILAGFLFAYTKYRKIQDDDDGEDEEDNDGEDEEHNKVERKLQYDNLMQKTRNAGGMATFAAGYGIYNVVTMNSDVMYMQPSNTLFQVYIAMNAFSVIAGLTCIIYDSFISVLANELPDQRKRMRFMFEISWMADLCDVSYKASLAAWLGVFAMYGHIKIWDQTVTPARYIYIWATYWHAGITALIILVVAVQMRWCYNEVFELRWSGSEEEALPSGGIPAGDLKLTRELKRQTSMNVMAAGVNDSE